MDPKFEDYRVEVVLARILADWGDTRAIAHLLHFVKHLDQGAVDIASEGLLAFPEEAVVFEGLSDMVKGPVVRERRTATRVLSKIGGPKAVELFGGRYKDERDPEVRGLFLLAIRENRHPRRKEFLIDALTDDDPALREQAWWALKRYRELPGVNYQPGGKVEERAEAVALLRLWAKGQKPAGEHP
jgi:HEAT repeat protein